MKLIVKKWFILSIAIYLASVLLNGFSAETATAIIIASALLGIFNVFIKPVLIFITLPINLLTLGLFTFVINALLLYMVSSIVKGIYLDSFWSALLASIIISILSMIINWIFADR
ncbi:MAG TPA: phage holin family protein [Spirochaetota bacterium]|nr:phage holin family protein [Spirochaetota bacterium]HOT18763.1 phage holin family protein [Spirochaetota bacterium]HPD06205.1 phage holin family protein [Spirochaetota bacterium]HPK45428.1 phage holin family protein [Spirochaetota bacterium]HQG42336.1 phage holin family protein [Spirochaetota bacterium]